MNRYQQNVIAYIQEENRILKYKLQGKRIRFTDDERRRLPVKGKSLGLWRARWLRELGDTGLEPVTSCVSRKRSWAPNALITNDLRI